MRSARLGLGGALGGAIALVAVWFCAFHVRRLQLIDQKVLRGFVDLQSRPHVHGLAARIAAICNPAPYAVLAGLIILLALLRRRPWLAAGAAVALFAAPLTTELLKPALAAPRPAAPLLASGPIAPGSWPSGHATAALSLGLGLTLVAGSRLRPWAAAAGAAFAAAVCFSFLTLEWHYPSDVLGGFLIAFIWVSLGAAVIARAEGRAQAAAVPSSRRAALAAAMAPFVVAVLALALLGGVVVLVRPHPVIQYAAGHRSFLAGAGAIALLSLVLATGVSLLGRR